MTRVTAILIGIAILLLFAHLQLWLFGQIDRAMERAETRRSITMQDAKTKWMYRCYRTQKRR